MIVLSPGVTTTNQRFKTSYAKHKFEKEGKCIACTRPWVHARNLCSICYNVARDLLKRNAPDGEVIAYVRADLSIEVS